jgi:glycosyltransferase involved in cell wall biosynthesis
MSKILFLNWKDEWSPDAGGAEVVHTQIIDRLVADGHAVTLLTQHYAGSLASEARNGYDIIRVGTNRYAHTLLASIYYFKNLRNKYDIVVSCNNTAPYFVGLLKGREKHFSLYHQLARQVWWHETRFPLNYIGYYILEPIATWLQSMTNPKAITISESTKVDLMRFGFKSDNINMISEGIDISPIDSLDVVKKYEKPTILSFGAMRSMKRTLDIVMAYEIAKDSMSDLRLAVAGSTKGIYAQMVLDYISQSRYKADIDVLGRVSIEDKITLMQKSHLIAVTSVKEGWGLIVTEAASQGTPACVYDVDGLRDSVRHGETGLVCSQSPRLLALNVLKCIQDKNIYNKLQINAWEWSKEINFNKTYEQFKQIISE